MDAREQSVRQVAITAEVQNAQLLNRSALRLKFAPTTPDLAILRRLYEPQQIHPGTGLTTQHGVLAGHLQMAERELHNFARGNGTIIEIGPSLYSASMLSRAVPGYHGCTLTSTRDRSRHISALHSNAVRKAGPQFSADAAALAFGHPSHTFCVAGVQNCAVVSRVAIANHSLYDITLSQMADAFHLHGLHVVMAALHMPEELHYQSESCNSDLGYRFVVKECELRVRDLSLRGPRNRRRVYFSGPHDSSDAYVHDYDTWMAYMMVRHINTPYGFALHIEPIKRFGSQVFLRITRTNPGDLIAAFIPQTYHGICKVPNVLRVLFPGATDEPKWVTTMQSKVDSMLMFMATRGEKETLSLDKMMTYARSRVRAILVNKAIVEDSWPISPEDLYRVVTSLAVIHTVERRRMEMGLRKAVERINRADAGSCLGSVISECAGLFRECMGDDVPYLLARDDDVTAMSVENLGPILREVQLSFEDCGVLPATLEMPYCPHDPEALRFLRDGGDYSPTAPPAIEVNPQPGASEHARAAWLRAAREVPHYTEVLAKQARETPSKALQSILDTAVNALQHLKVDDEPPCRVRAIFGAPGCGKTAHYLSQIAPCADAIKRGVSAKKVLFISPTQQLRDDVDGKIAHPARAVTQHVALGVLARAARDGECYDEIAIDECFMHPLVYIKVLSTLAPEASLVLLGDPKQIGYIDFSGDMIDSATVNDIAGTLPTTVLNATMRCPQDVVALPFVQRTYPGLTSSSKRENSIVRVGVDFRDVAAQVLTFTQEEKSRCSLEGAITVHEAQGRTFSSVILHYNGTPGEQKLLSIGRHLIVGLTRHTMSLYIREPGDEVHEAINNDDKVEQLLGDAPMERLTIAPQHEVTRAESERSVPPASACAVGALEILVQRFGSQPDCGCPALSVPHYETDFNDARINLALAQPDPEPRPYRRFGEGQWVKVTGAQDTHQALQTLLTRYTKRAYNISERNARADASVMMRNLRKYFDFTVDVDARDRAIVETLQKFTERGHTIDDLIDPLDTSVYDVQFLMKTQQKVTDKTIDSGKVGQGIAAHSKTANFALAVSVRVLEEVLRTGARNVRYSNGLPDEEEAMLLEAHIQEVKEPEFLAVDWTEFDTAHNNVSVELFALVLAEVGASEAEVQLFRARCGRRMVRAIGLGDVKVDGLLDSGAVWTLARNTVFNAAVMLTLVSGVKFAAFKGDDALLVGRNLQLKPARLHCGDYWEKKHLKLEKAPVASYIGLLVCAEHVTADPMRVARKVFGRCYSTEVKYLEYQTAVADITDKWGRPTECLRMCHVAAAYYNMDVASVDYVVQALRRMGRGDFKFNSLQEVTPHNPPPSNSRYQAAQFRSQCPIAPVTAGFVPIVNQWAVPAVSSSSGSSTPATPSTSFSRSPSSSVLASSFGRLRAGIATVVSPSVKRREEKNLRVSSPRLSHVFEPCPERAAREDQTAHTSTAQDARRPSSCPPQPIAPPMTPLCVERAVEPLPIQSCDITSGAGKITSGTAPPTSDTLPAQPADPLPRCPTLVPPGQPYKPPRPTEWARARLAQYRHPQQPVPTTSSNS